MLESEEYTVMIRACVRFYATVEDTLLGDQKMFFYTVLKWRMDTTHKITVGHFIFFGAETCCVITVYT